VSFAEYAIVMPMPREPHHGFDNQPRSGRKIRERTQGIPFSMRLFK
jgi:hypothetical protein